MAVRHGVDEYLETIYFLALPIGEYRPHGAEAVVRSARVAEILGISRASSGEMLRRLEEDGLIERGEGKEVILTAEGRTAAERAVRRHRIIECFLTDFMGYSPAETHEQAELIGPSLTDDMIERIAERLGNPDRCPHGWPIEPDVEQRENAELTALSQMGPGERGVIMRIAEQDDAILSWCYAHDLTPGVEVVIDEVAPAADMLGLVVDGTERSVSAKVADALYLRQLVAT
jgi:DtxR family Mn-dependent transcriptional regulator